MRAPVLCSILLFGLATVSLAQGSTDDKAIPPEEARHHVGKTVAVEGRCISTKRLPLGVELYFSAAFKAFIPLKSLPKFSSDPMKRFPRRNLRVTGKIEDNQGLIFMMVNEPDQIEIIRPRQRTPSS